MAWDLREAAEYYRKQGAPGDQNALIAFLRETQQENGGSIPGDILPEAAELLSTRESLLLALIRRISSLRLGEGHCLELCAGPNCSRRAALAAYVEKTYGAEPAAFTVKYVSCMRMCGKGPNIRWDGRVYNGADESLIRRLVEGE